MGPLGESGTNYTPFGSFVRCNHVQVLILHTEKLFTPSRGLLKQVHNMSLVVHLARNPIFSN